jgi:hypothetical protein
MGLLTLVQPDVEEGAVLDAWYMDDSKEDQRLPHRFVAVPQQARASVRASLSSHAASTGLALAVRPLPCRQAPNKPCPLAKLRELGVLYWRLDADSHESDPRLAAIRRVRNYSYTVGGWGGRPPPGPDRWRQQPPGGWSGVPCACAPRALLHRPAAREPPGVPPPLWPAARAQRAGRAPHPRRRCGARPTRARPSASLLALQPAPVFCTGPPTDP